MDFEWDEAKCRANEAKHGVSFEVAMTFDWLEAIVELDMRKDYGEERFIARGFCSDGIAYTSSSRCEPKGFASSPCGGSTRRITSDMEYDRKRLASLPDDDPIYGVPDEDTPELTEESIRRLIPAKQFFAERGLPLPGRPKSESPKVAVSLRLDQEVVDGFKADGPGWQTRMNAVLAESLRKNKKSA